MLRRADFRYGAIIPALAVENELEEPKSAAAMRARHRRFRENRRRRELRDQVSKRDDEKATPGDETPSSDDESSTVKPPPPATSSLSLASTSTATLASTTTSLIAATTTSAPPPPARTTLSSIPTSILSTSSSFSPVPVQVSSVSASISAAPEVQSSTLAISTSTSQPSTTSFPQVIASSTITSPVSSSTADATGLADNKGVTQISKMSGVETALIVIGVFFTLIVIGLTTWAFINRSSLIRRFKDRRGNGNEQNEKGPIFAANRRDSADDESRIWGAASTVGAKTETEVDFPAYVPPSFQEGGIRGPGPLNTTMNGPEVHPGDMIMPPSPPRVAQRPMSRWPPVRNSVTLITRRASVPRFRDIKSWARDQRRRGPGDDMPDMPTRAYQRFD